VSATDWKVTGVVPGSVRMAAGNYVPGFTVTYQTADGSAGSVQIARADYNADALRALIQADVAQLAEIKNLTGG
jgi:hypothetical protein